MVYRRPKPRGMIEVCVYPVAWDPTPHIPISTERLTYAQCCDLIKRYGRFAPLMEDPEEVLTGGEQHHFFRPTRFVKPKLRKPLPCSDSWLDFDELNIGEATTDPDALMRTSISLTRWAEKRRVSKPLIIRAFERNKILSEYDLYHNNFCIFCRSSLEYVSHVMYYDAVEFRMWCMYQWCEMRDQTYRYIVKQLNGNNGSATNTDDHKCFLCGQKYTGKKAATIIRGHNDSKHMHGRRTYKGQREDYLICSTVYIATIKRSRAEDAHINGAQGEATNTDDLQRRANFINRGAARRGGNQRGPPPQPQIDLNIPIPREVVLNPSLRAFPGFLELVGRNGTLAELQTLMALDATVRQAMADERLEVTAIAQRALITAQANNELATVELTRASAELNTALAAKTVAETDSILLRTQIDRANAQNILNPQPVVPYVEGVQHMLFRKDNSWCAYFRLCDVSPMSQLHAQYEPPGANPWHTGGAAESYLGPADMTQRIRMRLARMAGVDIGDYEAYMRYSGLNAVMALPCYPDLVVEATVGCVSYNPTPLMFQTMLDRYVTRNNRVPRNQIGIRLARNSIRIAFQNIHRERFIEGQRLLPLN
jgi:hypothetical protein